MISPSEPRDRIILAARTLFCRKGYAAVGTQEICELAEVKKGSLYHFYPSKLELAVAALQHFGGTAGACFTQVISKRETAAGKVLAVFELERQEAAQQKAETGFVLGCLLANLSQELTASESAIQQCVQQIYAKWRGILKPIFELSEEQSKTDSRTTEDLAGIMLSFMNGAILSAKIENNPSVIARLGKSALPLLGLEKRVGK